VVRAGIPDSGTPFRHRRQRKNEQQGLWKAAGRAMGLKVGRCWHVQISELFSLEKCDQAVMDFLTATDEGSFLPGLTEAFIFFILIILHSLYLEYGSAHFPSLGWLARWGRSPSSTLLPL
jgi:hypothetical protein